MLSKWKGFMNIDLRLVTHIDSWSGNREKAWTQCAMKVQRVRLETEALTTESGEKDENKLTTGIHTDVETAKQQLPMWAKTLLTSSDVYIMKISVVKDLCPSLRSPAGDWSQTGETLMSYRPKPWLRKRMLTSANLLSDPSLLNWQKPWWSLGGTTELVFVHCACIPNSGLPMSVA